MMNPKQEGPHTAPGSPQSMRRRNLHAVLEVLRNRGTLSIYEISGYVGLSKTTVTKLVAGLVEKGQVCSQGKGPSTEEGGKKPELFSFAADYAYTISILFAPHSYRGALYDLCCNKLGECTLTPEGTDNYRQGIGYMARLVERLLRETGVEASALCGIAVGCEGVVDAENGILHYAIHHSWGRNLPIGQDLQDALGLPVPVYVDNACRFMGYHEVTGRQGEGEGCVVTIYADATTGGCIMQDKRLIQGSNGFVGELGHIVIELDSAVRCSCSGYGCFEALVSPPNVLEYACQTRGCFTQSPLYEPAGNGTLDIQAVFRAADKADPFARLILDRVIKCFAALIHNVILLHDPQRIIIQGIYAGAGDYFLSQLNKKVGAFPFFKIKHTLPVLYSTLDFSGDSQENFILGGATYVADDYVRNRIVQEGFHL